MNAEDVIASGCLDKPLSDIGKAFYVANFEAVRDDDVSRVGTTGSTGAPLSTVSDRVSKMRALFRAGHEHAALIACIRSTNLKPADRAKANELVKRAVATPCRVSEV